MRPASLFLIAAFCFSALGWIWQDPVASKDRQARKLYNEGNVDEALSKWRDAQIESPEKEELHYNIGNALHGQKKYEGAFNEYEKALDSKDAELQSKTYYNMGNTHYRMGKFPEAIEDYKKCLDINPDDEDAKYNIEFIKKKLEEQKKEEPKESQAQQSQTRQKESQGKEEDKEQAQKQQSLEERQQEESNGAEKQEKVQSDTQQALGSNDERRTTNDEKGEMSKEDALRLLDAVKDDEKDLQKELRTKPGEGRYRVEKDW